jgi:hypothetical protein
MATVASSAPTPEITIDVAATDEGDWLICGLCPDTKFVPLAADQAASERASRWIARHQRGEHVSPRTCAGRD